MASKKNLLVVALVVLIQSAGLAQTDWGWDWKDTSKIAVKNLPQHNEFLNNQYPYPARPRDQWELGFGAGYATVVGDVNAKAGFGGTVSLRKSLNHTFSVRTGLTALWMNGTPNAFGVATGQFQYKNRTYQLGVDVIASLNAASNYRGNPKTNVYLLGGYALNASLVQYRNPAALGAQPGGYSYYYGYGQPNSQDGTITTFGGATQNGRHAYTLYHGLNLGAGIAFKVNSKVNVALEHKYTFTFPGYDLLDAYKGGNSDDYIGFTSFRVNINIGNKAKRVEPLWWLNPNNFIYSELNSPKHMKLPKVVLPDADGDGVTDQFDLEPNTPKGAPVDSHGVSKDTDGDGVPDFRDKEVLTQKSCFPVNNDGVGTCPEPACCKELRDMIGNIKTAAPEVTCNIGNLPSVQFKGNAKLSKAAEATLASAAATINANPNCKVKVTGYGASSKAAQQLSWERVNAVIKYLSEKQGVSESRLIFVFAQDGDANTVDLQGTLEGGPNTVPAPHPNLRSKN
ncbi:OmpA family protein [Sediminibacterium roseum]|uniref:OmpA family protein n=1 Tax=Sediminibacterium roseum TaxID=1978412 RepID=A0ABW9ZVU1_9BACT|nr:OmpA family protein [Sediminibacterium roseum]NCI51271.1 OmpA family protein [Sediminibacterium roseum]